MEPLPPPIAQYELLEHLGTGGMGQVFLARKGGVLVALKTMRADQANEPRIRTLFAREMRLAASIRHPNVAHVLASGEEDGAPYLVMEWVDGCSLRAMTRAVATRGPIPLAVSLRITADVCAGLHAAHELTNDQGAPLGLVHRDVSPHNVIVARTGTVKLIDFGVAKVFESLCGETTSSGGVKGKVRYMAPEQARARPVDRRADVFALGAVLFDLVTGRAPFEGPNDLAILSLLLTPEPVAIPSSVPAPVASLLARALAKKPAARFATAAEMQAAIEDAIEALGLAATTACVASFVDSVAPPSRLGVFETTATTTAATLLQSSFGSRPARWRRHVVAATVALACLGTVGAHRLAVASRAPSDEALGEISDPSRVARSDLAPMIGATTPPSATSPLDAPMAPPRATPNDPPARQKPARAGARPTVAPSRGGVRDDMTTSLSDRR